MSSLDDLIDRLNDRLRYSPAIESHRSCRFSNETCDSLPPFRPYPVISLAEVAFVERHLGFTLPTSVRRLSLEVADGGYGPSWGIFRLKQPPGRPYGFPHAGTMSVESWNWLDHNADEYDPPTKMEESLSRFPAKFIRYCEVGCNINICVDCTSDNGQVFITDPNTEEPFEKIIRLDQTVVEWLWNWVNNEPWPETKYAAFDIHPDTQQGPNFGCINSAREPNLD